MTELQVGTILKKYREKMGLSCDELAEKLDIWNRYVPLWESGLAFPDSSLQENLVKVLEIPFPDAAGILEKKKTLNIKTEELTINGLKGEYRFLHIADLHAVLYDDREREDRAEYLKPRIKDFSEDGINPTQRMASLIDYIHTHASELDAVLLSGDIIDCPSEKSLEYLKDLLESLPVPYMFVLGNHDWQYADENEKNVAKFLHRHLFNDYTLGNPYFHKKKFGELTFLGVDNSVGYYEAGLADVLKQAIIEEKNIILLQHIPFYAATLSQDNKTWWHGQDYIFGSLQDKGQDNRKVYELVTAGENNVKAVFAGHQHFFHHDILDGGIPQYIAPYAASGGAILYHIHG